MCQCKEVVFDRIYVVCKKGVGGNFNVLCMMTVSTKDAATNGQSE